MIQAKNAHSMLPSNSSAISSRRRFLVQSAIATAAIATTAPAAFSAAAAGPDPVYAAIARYRRLSVEHTAAVDRSGDLEPEDPD